MAMMTSRCHRRRAATCASHYCRAISSSACVSPTPPPLPKKYAFAIVGSGPAGMYAVEKLLNLERKTFVKGKTTDSDTTTKKKVVIRVDVYEKECFPYGLVRYGVAPDHAATKNVTNKFDALLRDARVRLFANVKVGDEASRVDAAAADDDDDDDDDKSLRVSTKELLKNYSGVVLAHGAADNDRKLQIENEDRLRGVYGARQFVNWFNGLPSAAPMRNKEMHEDIVDRLQRKKKGTNVVIVGVGNVALDCARILLRSTEELKETDIASHALEALEKANVKSVTIIGRRSVAQAKFSPKELREVIGLPNLDVQIDDLEVAEEDVEEMNASRPRRRAFEVLEKAKKAVATDGDVEGKKKKKTLRILFLRSPTALLPEVDDDDANPSSLGFVKIRKNILEGPTGNRKAKTLSDDLVGSEDETILPCDILIRSVGYVGDKLEPSLIPSDNNGTIAHDGLGRVQYKTDDSSATGRLYVCGWAKRGASGVIATNVQCAEETALAIEEDILNDILKPVVVRENNTNDEPSSLLQKSGDDKDDKKNHRLLVTAAKWFELDAIEREGGLCSKDDDDDDDDDKDDDDGKRTPSSSSSARRRTPPPRPGSRRIKIVDRDRALAFLQSRRFA
jgi:adrenodoxin-NADP+ reductase